MERFFCPACNRKATLKHLVPFGTKERLYFGCTNDTCRNHFQVLRVPGFPDHIVAQSPTKEIQPRPSMTALGSNGLVPFMGCPGCGNYGPVKMTYPTRADGKWRRHKCKGTCGYYYTCETEDGTSVHRKMKAKKPIDLFGEDEPHDRDGYGSGSDGW